ncbi:MAG: Hsp20/alpha crystallin family protein [Saprospiraceae bacterium]
MNLVKFKPAATWSTFDQLFDGLLKDVTTTLGTDGFVGSRPAVNISENKESFLLELAAPGLNKEDFKVSVEKNMLTVAANKETKSEEGNQYRRREFNYLSFKRSFHLPSSIDANAINATYENGVLYLTLSKKEEAKEKPARLIEIV